MSRRCLGILRATTRAWFETACVEAQEARLASAKKSNPGDMTAWYLVWKVFCKFLV